MLQGSEIRSVRGITMITDGHRDKESVEVASRLKKIFIRGGGGIKIFY